MSVMAEKIAAEFMRLLDEGWTPDVDEFLHRVPEEHRDSCRQHIDQLRGVSTGPRRLTKAEAMAMFADMEAATAG